jgi:octanoyl-[GcvH]:protein N-octanoyltransferase
MPRGTRPALHVYLDDGFGDAALDTAVARALLERVDAGELPGCLRLSRPTRVVAYGRQDANSPAFGEAVARAHEVGFGAVLRLAGGRAAVFHPGTIAFAWAAPSDAPREGITRRFSTMAQALTSAFGSLGVDARIGEVPGEYCAGRWSVNVAGRRKVAGIGQRLLPRAAHTGGVVVVHDAAAVVRALTPVYDALGLSWRPEVTGALEDAAPVTWDGVRDSIVDAFSHTHTLLPAELDGPTLARARSIADEHRVEAAP